MASMRKTYEMVSTLRWNLYEICSTIDVPSDVMIRLFNDLKVLNDAIDNEILKSNKHFVDYHNNSNSDEET